MLFDDCQSQTTWTKSSIASLMTSLYGFTHGIVSDADTIPAGSATLAAQLRNAGYVTASIVSTPFVGRATGLDRGFDYLLEYPIILRQVNANTDRGTDSSALNKVVLPWLDAHHNEPFFLYAHATIRMRPTIRRHPSILHSPSPQRRPPSNTSTPPSALTMSTAGAQSSTVTWFKRLA